MYSSQTSHPVPAKVTGGCNDVLSWLVQHRHAEPGVTCVGPKQPLQACITASGHVLSERSWS